MPRFNIWYDMVGPGGCVKYIPNKPQGIESEDLRSVLEGLSKGLPQPFGCKCTKVIIEEVRDAQTNRR